MSAPMTAAELQALIGLPGVEVHDYGRRGVVVGLMGVKKLGEFKRAVLREADEAQARTVAWVRDEVAGIHDRAARALALPTCAEVRALIDAARLARDLLEWRTDHDATCPWTKGDDDACGCGLVAALAALRAVLRD